MKPVLDERRCAAAPRRFRQRRWQRRRLLPAAIAAAAAGLLQPAQAIDLTWFGGSGDWSNGANWLPLGPPGPDDIAIVNAGTASLGTNTTIGGLTMTGGQLGGTATLNVSGDARWTGGTMKDAGTTTVNGTLTISGGGVKFLDGSRMLQTRGTTLWTGNGAVNGNEIELNGFSGTSIISNSGTWLDQNNFDTSIINHQGYVGRFANSAAGSYVKSGASTTTIDNAFDNAGVVDVQAGTLVLGKGGNSSSGSFHVADGATLVFGNTFTKHLLDQVSFTGTGTLRIESSGGNASPSNTNTIISGVTRHAGLLQVAGMLGISDSFSVQSYSQTSGVVNGAGTLHVVGDASWTGGTMQDSGTTTVDGTLTISGSGVKFLDGSRVLQTRGTTLWTGNGAVNGNEIELNGFSGTSIISNSGTWLDQNAFDTSIINHQGYVGRFVNSAAGSYVKSGASTTTIANAFDNAGSVDVQAGTLVLGQPFANAGDVLVRAGASLSVTANRFDNSGSLRGAGTLRVAAGTTLTNSGLIDPGSGGSGTLAAGTRLAPSNDATAIGRLTVAGNLAEAAGSSLRIDLADAGLADELAVTGALTLGGSLDLWNAGYTPVLGDSFVVVTYGQRLANSSFASLLTHGFAPGTEFTIHYDANDVRLTVDAVAAVPEPQGSALLLAGLGLVALRLRRRRRD